MDKVAMIGAGNVGSGLGQSLTMCGIEVVFGVLEQGEGDAAIEACGEGATEALVADAVAQAELVFLAVPGQVAVDAVAELDLEGKILVDCTNPMRWEDGPVWTPPEEGSNAAAIAAATQARVVKGFNTFGAEFHADPATEAGPVDVQLASDDAEALEVVAGLAERAGFAPIPSGGLRNAAVLENVAMLWIHLALTEGRGRDRALKMVGR